MLPKNCIVLASGSSVLSGIPLGLSNYLEGSVCFSLNDNIQFVDSTVSVFGDWTCYADRFELFKNHPLVIGRFDCHIGRKIESARECPKHDGLILLQGSGKYHGAEGLSRGLYSSVLTGAFTVNLVIILGFKEIFLCGFDNREINGFTHWYQAIEGAGQFKDFEGKDTSGVGKNERGEYRTSFYNNEDASINALWEPFTQEKDISIFNVSPESRINVFPKIDYPEMFKRLDINKNRVNQFEVQREIRSILEPFNKLEK
jgi:hypothetical protein